MKKIKLESVFNEFTLMGIAVSGAFYLGEYWEGIAVILFYLIGEWFQHKAVHKARSDIKALLDVRPETATVIYNNTYKITVPEKVQPGETIEVKVGEKVPLDGFLLEDSASFNTAALTGERCSYCVAVYPFQFEAFLCRFFSLLRLAGVHTVDKFIPIIFGIGRVVFYICLNFFP